MESIRTISILGIEYTIQEVDVVDKYNPSNGLIEYGNCTIKIDKNLPTDYKNRVLMHEIVHGTLSLLGYREDAENEQKVQGLATALHLLMQSPEPIFFLLGV